MVGELGTLGVVMPVYNEGQWPTRALAALRRSAERAGWPLHVVLVDDGSTDPESVRVLDALGAGDDVTLIRQENTGRFAARRAGIDAADGEYTLLLDARVEVDEEALGRIAEEIRSSGPAVWNFDVYPSTDHMSSLFWNGITKVWWRDYFRDRRHVAFTDEDFDRYPKGTGAFFAPTALLRDSMTGFTSHFDDHTLASDDTSLLRALAERQPINLTPDIHCRHHAKSGLRQWIRQSRHRGTTFVDGYLRDPSRAPMLLGAMGTVAGGIVVAAAVAPRETAGVAVAGCAVAAAATRSSGGSWREAGAVGLLTIPFAALFGSAAVRGLIMAMRAHRSRARGTG